MQNFQDLIPEPIIHNISVYAHLYPSLLTDGDTKTLESLSQITHRCHYSCYFFGKAQTPRLHQTLSHLPSGPDSTATRGSLLRPPLFFSPTLNVHNTLCHLQHCPAQNTSLITDVSLVPTQTHELAPPLCQALCWTLWKGRGITVLPSRTWGSSVGDTYLPNPTLKS